MENSNRSAEEALDGSTSSHQRILRQEGAPRDVPIIPEQRVDSAQPLGSSSAPICCQLPHYLRRSRDNKFGLIASPNYKISWGGYEEFTLTRDRPTKTSLD